MFNFLTRNSSQVNVKSFYCGEATWLVRRKARRFPICISVDLDLQNCFLHMNPVNPR
jgi:hypothetical protein